MTDCRTQLTFSFHPCKAVVADFQGGLITFDAGLLPIRQLDQRLGWTARMANILADNGQAGKEQWARCDYQLPRRTARPLAGL